MTFLSRQINPRPWLCWLLFLVLVLAVFAPSLGTSPPVWQDEVQIVDYGRVLLDPATDWAVTWSAREQKALLAIPYLGCIGAELAYRFTGTVLGSRLFCIAGGLLLGSMVFCLARLRKCPPFISLLFAALVMLDPGVLQSYCGGRLDALAMAFVLAGALCLHCHAKKQDWRWLLAAALALACAPYVWPRAVMAIPAALLPLLFTCEMPARKLLRTLLLLVALTAVFALLLLPPAWPGLQALRALADSPAYQFRALAGGGGMKDSFAAAAQMLSDAWNCFHLAVPLVLLAALGMAKAFFSKELGTLRKTLVALVLAATLLLQLKLTTGLHHFSALYLLPLLVMLALHGMESLASGGQARRPVRWLAAAMTLLLAAFFLLAADQSYAAWLDRATFGPKALLPVVKSLPPAHRRLIVDDFRLYFLLRSSGFQPFYLFTDVDPAQHQFRFYAPSANSDFQPFYFFIRADKSGHGEIFSPASTPALLAGGSTSVLARWSAYCEKQLRHSDVRQLPQGYRLVAPAQK